MPYKIDPVTGNLIYYEKGKKGDKGDKGDKGSEIISGTQDPTNE